MTWVKLGVKLRVKLRIRQKPSSSSRLGLARRVV